MHFHHTELFQRILEFAGQYRSSQPALSCIPPLHIGFTLAPSDHKSSLMAWWSYTLRLPICTDQSSLAEALRTGKASLIILLRHSVTSPAFGADSKSNTTAHFQYKPARSTFSCSSRGMLVCRNSLFGLDLGQKTISNIPTGVGNGILNLRVFSQVIRWTIKFTPPLPIGSQRLFSDFFLVISLMKAALKCNITSPTIWTEL